MDKTKFILSCILLSGGVTEILNVQNNGDGTYLCDYYPHKPGQYVVSVNYGGQPGAGSPYRVSIVTQECHSPHFCQVGPIC